MTTRGKKGFLLVGLVTSIVLVLHVYLGWPYTLVGASVAGFYQSGRPWLIGGVAAGLAWSLIIVYRLVGDPEPTLFLLNTMGSVVGGLPGWLYAFVSVFIGALLGSLGARIGDLVYRLILVYRSNRTSGIQSL